MNRFEFILADDNVFHLNGVRHALDEQGVKVLDTARTASSLIAKLSQHPDVNILITPTLPGLSSFMHTRLLQRYPEIEIYVLGPTNDDAFVKQILAREGVIGYISEQIEPEDLAAALRTVKRHDIFYPTTDFETHEPIELRSLTVQERNILTKIALGKSNSFVAKELFITEQTVKFHLTNIYRKLGVKNRTEATRYALDFGFINFQPSRPNEEEKVK